MKVQRAESPAILAGHEQARRFFAPCFDAQRRPSAPIEQLWVAHVDEGARCLHLAHYAGNESSAELPVRAIMRDAMRFGSAGLLLAHDHPSGDPTPSTADCLATRRLALAGEALDVAVVDHLIFAADGECRSLRRMGLL